MRISNCGCYKRSRCSSVIRFGVIYLAPLASDVMSWHLTSNRADREHLKRATEPPHEQAIDGIGKKRLRNLDRRLWRPSALTSWVQRRTVDGKKMEAFIWKAKNCTNWKFGSLLRLPFGSKRDCLVPFAANAPWEVGRVSLVDGAGAEACSW